MSFNPGAGSFSGSSDVALSGAADGQLIGYDSGTGKWTNRAPAITAILGLQTALDAKVAEKNNVIELTDSTNDDFVRVNITDDATPTAGWTDRLAFYFAGRRAGYFNEYGELRARPGKNNSVGFRAMGDATSNADQEFFQVASGGFTDVTFGISKEAINTYNIKKTNTFGSNLGGAYLERTNLNYALDTTNPDLSQVYVNSFKSSWMNEWGALRGTSPHSWGDSLVRAIRDNGDGITSSSASALEINDRRTGAVHPTMWGRKWADGSLVRNGNTMADVYVIENGATPPASLPAGTVIIEKDA